MAERKFYRLTNDLLFHIVMQESEVALKGLVASLLSKKVEEITSVEVLNPIDYSQRISSKEIILAVNARVNEDTLVNVEVQVRRYGHLGHLRSLYYAARMAAQSSPGKTYAELPIIRQFSILDYTFDKDDPEFFAEYELRNKKTGKRYTDRFCISIMDLTQRDLASPEDIASGRLVWAELFRAKSWRTKPACRKRYASKGVVDIMRTATKDDGISFAINEREIAEMDALSREKEAEKCGMERGLQRGLERGLKQGLQQGANESREAIRSNMVKAGFSEEEIALALGE